ERQNVRTSERQNVRNFRTDQEIDDGKMGSINLTCYPKSARLEQRKRAAPASTFAMRFLVIEDSSILSATRLEGSTRNRVCCRIAGIECEIWRGHWRVPPASSRI